MKKFLALALCLVLAFSLCACGGKTVEEEPTDASTESGAPSDLAYIQDKGKLVIGYTVFEPMNYTDENGEFTGFDTEFAKIVCEKLGVEPEFIEINWDNKFIELEARTIDCLWNGMTITDEVKNNASPSNPYVKNAQVVVMKSDSVGNYESVDSLKGLNFAAEAGSAGAAAIEKYELDPDYTQAGDQAAALLEVMSGAADACVIDLTMANAMIGEGTSYESLASGIELESEEYGVAFRKGSDVTEKFNEIMDELMNDGTLDNLAEKYSLTLVK